MHEKVVLITGSGKRVGSVVAQTLHQQGWRVIIHYRSSSSEATQLIQGLNAIRAHSAVGIQADLNKMSDIEKLTDQAKNTWGRIDALINNASSFYPTPIESATEAQWDDLFASNAKAPFFLAKALIPLLKESKGSIINMVDIHADRPLPNYPIYCMAKAALAALTKSLARDLGPLVRVNGIAPGMILWPSDNSLDDKIKTAMINRIPLKREGSPEDIAKTICFLLEESFISGHIIAVDGGRSIVA